MTVVQPANEKLGYWFHPPAGEHDIGHPQLDVVIRPAPTGEHFDPESFMCVIPATGGSAKLHVTHPWTQEASYRVCAGEIDVENAQHAHVRGFTFGGSLHLDSDARRTICQVVSPVPLLEHVQELSSLEKSLVEEVQILFAERRAVQDDDAFDRRLAAADPLQLYRACLVALNEKFAHFPSTDEAQRRFKQFLNSTAESLESEAVPTLADLL